MSDEQPPPLPHTNEKNTIQWPGLEGCVHQSSICYLSPYAEPVFINIEEKLSVLLNKQGGLENLEVQGTMSLVVSSDADAFVRVQVRQAANTGYQFKTHPNIDKAAYNAQQLLGLKDASRPFPTGGSVAVHLITQPSMLM